MSITQLRKSLRAIGETATKAYAGVVEASERVDSARMVLAKSLYEGSVLIASDARLGKFSEWAEKVAPGEDAYKLANAGAVAKVIGDVGRASERHLVPWYRILKSAKTEDERAAAEEVIRSGWASLDPGNGKVATEDAIRELVGTIKPDGGTRGKKAAAKGSKTAKGQKATTPDAPETDDPAARESAAKEVARITAKLVEAGADPATVRVVMSATVGLCEKHGVSVLFAVCKQVAADAKAAAKVKVTA